MSSGSYLEAPGVPIARETLTIQRAGALARLLGDDQLAFVRLFDCRTSEGREETIVFDVDVERPQICVHEIRCTERLAVTFGANDDSTPELVSLRADFPLVPHLNLREQEFPRSLCLYDQSWHEVKLRWTSPAFIEAVRTWLAQTAQGVLHHRDQPLEPFFLGSPNHIIVPHTILSRQADAMQWLDIVPRGDGNRLVLVARTLGESERRQGPLAHVATVLECHPVQHGVIRRQPRTLKELHDVVRPVGLDIISTIKERLTHYRQSRCADPFAKLVLVLLIPKCRDEGGRVESRELRSFLMTQNIEEIGIRIGLWEEQTRVKYGVDADTLKDGSSVPVHILNTHTSFNWEQAAILNDLPGRDRHRVVAVGSGALGSQLIINLARAGSGDWTIIDEDILLPHNLARHALDGYSVGWPKADGLARTINQLADDEAIATAIVGDVLSPGTHHKSVDEALNRADLIVDLAASLAVGRHLAHHPSPSRRVALFMNPRGTDLVLLAEDAKRQIRLDCVEIQYYRALCHDARLREHLVMPGSPIRCGQSCRDLSSRLPQDLVAMHAGLGARALRAVLMDEGPSIRIWTLNPTDLSVVAITAPVCPVAQTQCLEWTLIVDGWVLQKVFAFRKEKLPNETGGVLVGSYDMERKAVYVTDTIPSPPDSEEYPTAYIRGSASLPEQVAKIRETTGYNLDYIGEWHSHPDGYSIEASPHDAQLFSWLRRHMSMEGKPALLLIAGEDEKTHWWLA